MATLFSLPVELLCAILEHLEPVSDLPHPLDGIDKEAWDIRHWYKTLAAVARSCRLLNSLTIPLLCADILLGLQRHQKSLRNLRLEPSDQYLAENPDHEYAPIDIFRSLVALKLLKIPWMLLMGRPAGSVAEDGKWLPTSDDWQYPTMHEVLLPRLIILELDMGPAYSPGDTGYEEVLLSARPPDDGKVIETEDLLDTVKLVYSRMDHDKSLSMNFFEIQDEYEQSGYGSEYEVQIDLDHLWDDCDPKDDEFNILASGNVRD